MAPTNGATGKTAGPNFRTRPMHRPVVPVIPITFTKRAKKPVVTTAPTASPSPSSPKLSPAAEAGEEKVEHGMEKQEHSNDHENEDDAGEPTPSITPAETCDSETPLVVASHTAEIVVNSAGPADKPVAVGQTKPVSPPASEPMAGKVPSAQPSMPMAGPQPFSPIRMGPRLGHQAHLSNGSVVFGGFPSSDTSSPAPHMPGFPPGAGMLFSPLHSAPVDAYGRPAGVSPIHPAGYGPMAHNQGPPTPHSFHGSQASTQTDELNGFVARHVNGNGIHPVDHSLQLQPQPQSYANTHVPYINHRIQEGALGGLQSCFKEAEFADCTLEFVQINSTGEQRDLLNVPGHRFILGQSPVLRHLLRTRGMHHGILRVEVHDEYVRPEGLFFAIRTLYGWDLGDGPQLPTWSPLTNIMEDLDLALGYIATARFLQLPLVNMKAVHWASRLVRWDTVEHVCKFALPIAAMTPPTRHGLPTPRDEYSIAELLDSVVHFLVSHIPFEFELDSNVDDGTFSRLPRLASTPLSPISPASEVLAGAPWTPNGHLSRTQRLSVNPRLTRIQFGDIAASSDSDETAYSGTPSRRPATHLDTILSRVLLNLPFAVLKQTLEHPIFLKNPAAETITRAIVAERESRRLRSLDKSNAELHSLQEAVERTGKPLIVTQLGDFLVNNMGFKEEVFAGDAPYLVQTWSQGSGSTGSVSSS